MNGNSSVTNTFNTIAAAVAIQAKLPFIFWGDPGIGKTSVIQAVAKGLCLPLEVVIGSIRDPSDILGMPYFRDGTTHYAAPSWAKRLLEAQKGVVFFDEMSTAAPLVQAGMLRVVLERVVGELQLPESVAIAAAANPPESGAGAIDLTPPMANRLIHLQFELDPQAWVAGMISGWPTPRVPILEESWKDGVRHRMALIAAFIQANPVALFNMPAESKLQSMAWPSPRSWEAASKAWAACDAAGTGAGVTKTLVAGAVGEGAMMELFTYVEELDLPDPEAVLRDPAKLVLPRRGDLAHAVLAAVTSAVLRKNTPERWCAGWEVLAKAFDLNAPDIAAVSAKLLANNRPQGVTKPPAVVAKFAPLLVGSRPRPDGAAAPVAFAAVSAA